jgi:2-isopropylmalate synthase
VTAEDGRVFTGRGAHSDIIVASARAYTNALNRLLSANAIPNVPDEDRT